MLQAQWPAKIVEEFRQLDLEYMQNLKDCIAHFKSRLNVHTFNPVMRDQCKEILIMLRIELKQCEKDYLNDYGTNPVYSQGSDGKPTA